MTTSEVLASAWKSLEEEAYGLPGFYERRILANCEYCLFAGVARPSNLFQLSMDIETTKDAKLAGQETKGFRLYCEHSPTAGKIRLRLEVVDKSYRDLFLAVSSDILDKMLEVHDEQKAVAVLQLRIEHWKRFLEASGATGLSSSEQIGLFGELLLLRTLIAIPQFSDRALASWQGPKRANQDFMHGGRAIEVKTSAGNEPTRVRIANERQLDSLGLSSLVLCHVRVDRRNQVGKSLPVLVDEISSMISSHLVPSFLDSLVDAGYHDSQKHLYADIGFVERDRNYYQVRDGFPRITSSDLRIGVSEVSYIIDLSAASSLRTSESEVVERFLGTDDE